MQSDFMNWSKLSRVRIYPLGVSNLPIPIADELSTLTSYEKATPNSHLMVHFGFRKEEVFVQLEITHRSVTYGTLPQGIVTASDI